MATHQIINNLPTKARVYLMPMPAKTVTCTVCLCWECGHNWQRRIERPKCCPACKSPWGERLADVLYWNPDGISLHLHGSEFEYDPRKALTICCDDNHDKYLVLLREQAKLGIPGGIASLKAWEELCAKLGRNPTRSEWIPIHEKVYQATDINCNQPMPAA